MEIRRQFNGTCVNIIPDRLMLSHLELSDLLNAAIRQHSSNGANGSLIPFIVHELIARQSANSLAIWQIDRTGQVRLIFESQAEDWVAGTPDQQLSRIESGTVTYAESESGSDSVHRRFALTSAELHQSIRLVIGLELTDSPLSEPEIQQLMDLVAEIRRRELLDRYSDHARQQSQLLTLIAALHEVTDIDELLHRFATDGAVALNAKRISVASRSSTKNWDHKCSTGVDSTSPRSATVQAILNEIQKAENNLQTEHLAVPLSVSRDWASADYAALFEAEQDAQLDPRLMQVLADQLSMAIDLRTRRARRRRRVPRLSPITRFLLVSVIFGMLALSSMMMETDLEIRATGQAVPTVQKMMFAPDHGVISEIFVGHGEAVDKGKAICRIENDELKVLREKTREQLIAAQARLSALKATGNRSPATSNSALPSTVEQAELETRIESLSEQMRLLEERTNSLTLTAPFDGQVIQERFQEEYFGRPVQQGQALFFVADRDAAWEIQISIPENEARHVFAIWEQDIQPTVRFVLETAPTEEHLTELTELSSTTDVDEAGRLSTKAVAKIDHIDTDQLRIGAGVLAKIDCGRHSWWFVLTRGLREFWARHSPF